MYKVAVCDDEYLISSQLENFILDSQIDLGIKLEVDIYETAEQLLQNLLRGYYYDLIFLDIALPEMNGVELGDKIRKELNNQSLHIVYISGKDNFFRQAFKSRPMDFLSKPFEQEQIYEKLRQALKISNCLATAFTYRSKTHGGKQRIAVQDILYFENYGRDIEIHTIHGQDRFGDAIKNIAARLKPVQFLFINESTLVNYHFIVRFEYHQVTMTDGTVFPISQPRRKDIRHLQMRYSQEDI